MKRFQHPKQIVIALFLFAIGIFLLALFSTHGVTQTAEKQLRAIQSGDIDQAYQMTSQFYQQKNSLDKFKSFLNQYPILKKEIKTSFSNRKIADILATLTATLSSKDGDKITLDYQFIKENNQWKVQAMQFSTIGAATNDTAPNGDASGASIHGVLVSDTADKNNYVDLEKPLIQKTAAKIYVTVQVIAPQAGSTLIITIINNTTNEKVGTDSSEISKPGDVLKAFYFKPNGNTWTPGTYQVNATLSSGASQTMTFKIE